MPEYVIAIPSKGRPELIKKLTLKIINNLNNIYVFVEPQDIEAYKNSLSTDTNIITLDKNNQGVAYARRFIQLYFKDKNRYVFLLDDNIDQILVRDGKTTGGNPKLKKVTNIKEVFDEALQTLKEKNYAQLTFSFRPSNWCFEGDIKENTRSWGIVLLDNKVLNENNILYDTNADLFEDYDFAIQTLRGGLKNASLHKYAFHKKMAFYEGGCQTYRNKERSKIVCEYLKKKYGNFVVEIRFNESHKIFEPYFKWSKLVIPKNQRGLSDFV